MARVKEWTQTEVITVEEEIRKLVLYNDDVNTFDWVIQCLIEVCEHTEEQATQCAWLVHYKGKYPVLSGSYQYLEPRHNALADRGLSVNIE
ncbi:MAG: ATP-dependent Clp protease adaptor protein ClpS [Bacteroidia bacterium]|nr:MAG: ATP-dependent Clp protease adaptor protein ClpS [Bacteroidia bacterium]